MKTLKCTLFIYIAIASALVSCNKEDDFLDGQDSSMQPVIEVSVSGYEPADPATRATDNEDEFKTTLADNDQIGIYAVKNGKVISKNIPYKYERSAWKKAGDAAVSIVPGDNVSYFAYYPYRQEMDNKNITCVSDIITYFEVAADQSTHDLYTQNDLMTATGTLSDKTLSFTLNHALALIVVDLKGQRTPYVGGYAAYGAVSAISRKTIGTVTTPYQDAKGCFRALVKQGTVTPDISYTANGKTVTYSKAITAVAGKYSKKLIYAGNTTNTEKTISRGDYFYADGNISSNNTNDSSNPCIGIVLTTTECLEVAPYNHGLVVALKNVTENIRYTWGFWGAISNIPSAPNTCKNWFLPSDEQLKLMIWGNTSTQSLDGKKFLEGKMNGVANSENFDARGEVVFYSATTADYNNQWAINIKNGQRMKWNNGSGANARGILAF